MVGEVADYEIDADSQADVLKSVQLLYARPGITLVKVSPDYIEVVHGLPRT